MNVLAVEVFPPRPGDPTIGFVDWNPAPPDKNMGIWREVRVKSTGDVSINFPFVITKLDLETLKEADLTVSAELQNNSPNKVSGTLEGRLESARFSREVTLEPKESKKVVFTPEDTPGAEIEEPAGLVDPRPGHAGALRPRPRFPAENGKTQDRRKTRD